MELMKISGRLIVLEGPDGVGRTSHARLLSQRLEAQGVATANFGLARSALISEHIEANSGQLHNFGPRTRALLYATDMWDQVVHHIQPALDAGFVVVADRFSFTPVIRESVRGTSEEWLHGLYSSVPNPDMVIVLDAGPRRILHRVIYTDGIAELKGYESGMDLGHSNIPTVSFIHYQKLLRGRFKQLAKENNFPIVSTKGTFEYTHEEIWKHVEPIVSDLIVKSTN